jgi:hypothetical protein
LKGIDKAKMETLYKYLNFTLMANKDKYHHLKFKLYLKQKREDEHKLKMEAERVKKGLDDSRSDCGTN